MSRTQEQVKVLLARGEIRISEHGYDELAEDGISARDVVAGFANAELLEDYPAFSKGPCILVLEWDREKKPVHVVWGIPKGSDGPAVVVTAYRPDPDRWSDDFRRRK